jgi:hypothetical protein
MKKIYENDEVPRCEDKNCNSLVKPDIVFFGEELPSSFFNFKKDFPECDLLIIIGTSLLVSPFCNLVDFVTDECPRVLINMNDNGKLNINEKERDLGLFGDLQQNIINLIIELGWKEDFLKTIKKEDEKIENYFLVSEQKKKQKEDFINLINLNNTKNDLPLFEEGKNGFIVDVKKNCPHIDSGLGDLSFFDSDVCK